MTVSLGVLGGGLSLDVGNTKELPPAVVAAALGCTLLWRLLLLLTLLWFRLLLCCCLWSGMYGAGVGPAGAMRTLPLSRVRCVLQNGFDLKW